MKKLIKLFSFLLVALCLLTGCSTSVANSIYNYDSLEYTYVESISDLEKAALDATISSIETNYAATCFIFTEDKVAMGVKGNDASTAGLAWFSYEQKGSTITVTEGSTSIELKVKGSKLTWDALEEARMSDYFTKFELVYKK